jgi:putative pyoverdin transport system ATP-binding/permease protein
MEFFTFLEKESKALDRRLLILGALAAMINLFLLFALTAAANKVVQHESTLWDLTIVAIGLFSYWISEGFVLRRMTVVVEGILERVRLRIVEKIRYADLASIESIGKAPAYNAVSTHALNVSRGASGIMTAFTALAILCWASLIILMLSGTAFLILAGTLALVIILFNANQARMNAWMTASVNEDNRFLSAFGDLIDGFKELKMNSAKANDFVESDLRPLAASARELRTQAGLALNRGILLATVALFIVLAALVFLLPLFSPDQVSNLPRLMTFVVFLFGPLGQVVGYYPSFNEAVSSIREIQRVEKRLDSIYEEGLAEPVSDVTPAIPFESLQCTALSFSYRDERGQSSFSIEPLDFQLSRGELVFIVGGNGSGKSTFLKVLAGLYPTANGSIAVNGAVVGRDNRQSYRNLFSNVFSDFHLFDRLYGINEVDQDRVRDLLELTELVHKTSIVDRQITFLSLSSGQRKRLALVVGLLEDKPILLLDEWAAEQDRPFRRKFYREILPWLKEQKKKTVVAVTHDDDYYDVADRVLKMEFGRIVPTFRH